MATLIPSPNFVKGRLGYKPELVVIHIMAGTLAGTDEWFLNPVSKVSSHYGVGRAGEVHQYVQEADVAWHAGRVDHPSFSLYKPGINPNLYTVGIEHEGDQNSVWTDAQKKASAALIKDVCTRWNIPIDRNHIIGHYQVYSLKPSCPATNKVIIDQLIALAKGAAAPVPTMSPQAQAMTAFAHQIEAQLPSMPPAQQTAVKSALINLYESIKHML